MQETTECQTNLNAKLKSRHVVLWRHRNETLIDVERAFKLNQTPPKDRRFRLVMQYKMIKNVKKMSKTALSSSNDCIKYLFYK